MQKTGQEQADAYPIHRVPAPVLMYPPSDSSRPVARVAASHHIPLVRVSASIVRTGLGLRHKAEIRTIGLGSRLQLKLRIQAQDLSKGRTRTLDSSHVLFPEVWLKPFM